METKLVIKKTILSLVLIGGFFSFGCGQKGELFIPDSAVQQSK
jgi:predicted small lipoprotein YifL